MTRTQGRLRGYISALTGYQPVPPKKPTVTRSWSGCLTVLQLPALPESLHFRVHEEPVGDGTLLDWVEARLRNATESQSELVLLTAGSEGTRLRSTLAGRATAGIHETSTLGELHDLRHLAQERHVARLLLVDLTHSLLPPDLFRRLLDEHLDRANAATALRSHPCAIPPLLVETNLLFDLERRFGALPPGALPTELRPALDSLSRAAGALPRRHRIQLGALDASSPQVQTGRRWPYRVALAEPNDVAVLRAALEAVERARTSNDHDDADVLDEWAAASSRIRAGRLTTWTSAAAPDSFTTSSSAPRVLEIQAPSAFSGVEETVVQLAESLARSPAEYQCAAVVGLPGVFSDRLSRAGVEVRIARHDFARSSVESFFYSRSLLNALKPALVHAHSLVGVPFCCAVAERGLPLVQHVQVASEDQLDLLGDQIASASVVIAISEFVRSQLTRLGTPTEKIQLVYNGVHPDGVAAADARTRQATRDAIGVAHTAPMIVMPARFAPNKRHDVALESLAILRARMPDAVLVFAGEPPAGSRVITEKLDGIASRFALQRNVRFLGFRKDMASLYAAADAVLLPSEDEPLGLALLEGMAAGLPAVGARSGGIPEIIVHGVSGLLAEAGNASAFAEALERVLTDEELRERVVDGGRARVAEQFSVSQLVNGVKAVYARLIGV